MKHFLHMLIGCGLPMLLIFVLPLFGVSEGITLTVFIVLIFGCHLLMMRGHMTDHADHHTKHKEDSHEKTQYSATGFILCPLVPFSAAPRYPGAVFAI